MQPNPEAEAVIAANDAFYRAFNQRDMEAMESLWADRDDITCIHPGWNVLRGSEAVLESWRGIIGNPNQPRIVAGGAEVTFAGEVAVVVCRELVAGSPLAATNLFVRVDGSWRLLHHHSGPVAPNAL